MFTNITVKNLSENIHEVSNTKYLGIICDQTLRWDLHTAYLTKKLNFLVYKFYTLRNILDRKMLIMLYQSLVESILRYGILVWGSMYYTSLKPLQVIQNKILKIILKKPYLYPTQQIYNNTLVNVRTLFLITVCCYMHHHKDIRYQLHHVHNTRINADGHLVIPIRCSEFGKRSIKYLGPKLYNLLPNNIRNNKTKRYIKLVKNYIVENYERFVSVF